MEARRTAKHARALASRGAAEPWSLERPRRSVESRRDAEHERAVGRRRAVEPGTDVGLRRAVEHETAVGRRRALEPWSLREPWSSLNFKRDSRISMLD